MGTIIQAPEAWMQDPQTGRRADLRDAGLHGAVLSSAGLMDIPVVEELDAKILAAIAAGGSLDMRVWHTCRTTHCRAGWAITLAGDAGRDLEARVGSAAAGALIYYESTGTVPDFHASNDAALESIRTAAASRGVVPLVRS